MNKPVTTINPLVSIVIPTYNHACFIKDCLLSVINQTFTNWEAIVVNNYSSDNTIEVVNSFNDPRIKLINFKNHGIIAASRNQGIQLSKGKYIAFLDSDDLWYPDKLEKQVAVLEKREFKWVYCNYDIFNQPLEKRLHTTKLSLPEGIIAEQLIKKNFIPPVTPLFSKEIFDKLGGFNEDDMIVCREDWEMWLKVAALYPVKYIPERLASYRHHDDSNSTNEDINRVYQSTKMVIDNVAAFAPKIYNKFKKIALSNRCLSLGRTLINMQQFQKARDMLYKAIALSPTNIKTYPFWFCTLLDHNSLTKLIKLSQLLRQNFIAKK